MPMKPSLPELLESLSPELRKAFFAAIQDIQDKARIGDIEKALRRGDIEGAIRAVGVDHMAFRGLETTLAQIFEAGGAATMAGLPALSDNVGQFIIRFDARNPRAERWLRDHSSTLVSRIVEDQRAGIRDFLQSGMIDGRNPRNTALDIVGRINRATGRREGGIVGLTQGQERWARNAAAELLSGDETSLNSYLGRKLRDKRFDRSVMKAIREGKPLPRDIASKAIGRYRDNLLRFRGETIARTETLAALHQAQDEGFRQLVDDGKISRNQVRRIWHTSADERVRDSHVAVNKESVGLDERFSNGLLYPGEPGAPVEEVANCRCWVETAIRFLPNA